MIKLEHNIFHKRGIVAFAVEASTEKDIPVLDLFAEALIGKPDLSVGFVSSTRLVIQVSGMRKDIFEVEDR
jgi:hypothetical protein